MSNISIQELSSQYMAAALQLLNSGQGEGLFGSDYLSSLSKSESLVVMALDEKRLVGIGVAQIIHEFDYYVPFDPQICEELSKFKVGSFSTLGVAEGYQGKGIGQLISEKRLQWLKARACDVVVGVSWVSGLGHTSNRVFEKMGFRAIKRVDDFYVQSSINHPFYCPGCKVSPCQCAAIFYRLDLLGP